jgi:hypothetical protein
MMSDMAILQQLNSTCYWSQHYSSVLTTRQRSSRPNGLNRLR